MEIHPPSVFPGAGRVAPALANFARGNVGQSAVVAYPNTVRAADIAGLLAASGLAGQATNNGFEAVRLAAEPGVELVIIDLATIEPPIRETLFRFTAKPLRATYPSRWSPAKADSKKQSASLMITAMSSPFRGHTRLNQSPA